MTNFWDFSVWGGVNLVATLLFALIIANMCKRKIHFLRVSLIPTSVLGGLMLLIIAVIFRAATGSVMLDTAFYGGNGMNNSEILTYHCLALGFIATVFKPNREKLTRQREREIFNTGVTTVATYLMQAILGLGFTIIVGMMIKEFFAPSGILLPFGFGQGTGQALNWGSVYETDYGFVGGRSFGLTVAALGFLTASIGGVIHLNILSKKGVISRLGDEPLAEQLSTADVQDAGEIPMNGSIDKMTVEFGLVFVTYMITYVLIYVLGNLIPGFKSVLYGFNFLFGVLIATLINWAMGKLTKAGVINRVYINPFLMNRISGFCFDLMIVAGIAAIRIELIAGYWWILAVLCVLGAFSTYFYNRYVARKLFPEYAEEQFLAMFGMLTGTASTGVILLREIDRDFKTPTADNLVYQNFPAIVFGFPMMLLAALAPKQPILTFGIVVAFFIVMNIILFRQQIFKRNK